MFNDYPKPTKEDRRFIFSWGFWIIGIVIALIMVTGVAGFALDWLGLPGRIVDPDETLARWRWYYDVYQGLQGQAANIEQAEKSVGEFRDFNGDPDGWDWQTKDEYQRLTVVRDGYIMNYNRVAQEYNASMRDITRNYIRPGDLPECVPNWDVDMCSY